MCNEEAVSGQLLTKRNSWKKGGGGERKRAVVGEFDSFLLVVTLPTSQPRQDSPETH